MAARLRANQTAAGSAAAAVQTAAALARRPRGTQAGTATSSSAAGTAKLSLVPTAIPAASPASATGVRRPRPLSRNATAAAMQARASVSFFASPGCVVASVGSTASAAAPRQVTGATPRGPPAHQPANMSSARKATLSSGEITSEPNRTIPVACSSSELAG